MRLEDGVAVEWPPVTRSDTVGQRLQSGNHAGFPVDKRAVAVEGQNLEVREIHL